MDKFPSAIALSTVAQSLTDAAKSREELLAIVDALRLSLTRCESLLQGRIQPSPGQGPRRKELRIFLNGCFDIMHAGHYNALRQCKATFAGEADKLVLVVGVHSDKAIAEQKGPTVMNDEERCGLVRGCKFVDEVVEKLPYAIPVSLLDRLNCDYVVHGDDMPICKDGTGMYSEAIAKKRFRLIKRTEGMSTTLLIGRLLNLSKDHLRTRLPSPVKRRLAAVSTEGNSGEVEGKTQETNGQQNGDEDVPDVKNLGAMLPTTARLSQFFCSTGNKSQRLANAKRVVYVKGGFDMFHPGHLAFLKRARTLGDYLIVGLHADKIVNQVRGLNYPVMNLHERALCVLSCKYADDVVYGAPWLVTQDLITTMNVSVVACGRPGASTEQLSAAEGPDPYIVPREAGILVTISSGSDMSTDILIGRILTSREIFLARNRKKVRSEVEYLETRKSFVAEA